LVGLFVGSAVGVEAVAESPHASAEGSDTKLADTIESLVVRADGPFEGSGRGFPVRFLGGRPCFGPIAGVIPIRGLLVVTSFGCRLVST
jgi:hypothetical protein